MIFGAAWAALISIVKTASGATCQLVRFNMNVPIRVEGVLRRHGGDDRRRFGFLGQLLNDVQQHLVRLDAFGLRLEV